MGFVELDLYWDQMANRSRRIGRTMVTDRGKDWLDQAIEALDAPGPLSEALDHTTGPLSEAVLQRVSILEKNVKELKQVDHTTIIVESIRSQRKHDGQDEDLTAGLNQGKDKKRPRKDTQPSKKSSASKEVSKGNTSPKTSKSGKLVTVEEPDKEHVHDMSLDVEENIVNKMVYNLLKGTCQSSIELEYNMEECYKALSDQLDWTNPKGDRCPFNLSKPLPLKGRPGHLTVTSEYFFNNDLEYLKSTKTERNYTMSITKTKAGRYESQLNRFLQHDVYSTLKILRLVSVKVNKLHGYGYLEEIVHKLFHLDGDVIVDLAMALRIFTRSLIIKKRVKDVQLGVESYQKKLNITRTRKDFPTISAKEPYTPSVDLQGVVYEDLRNQKRLMRADELYKFSNETLSLFVTLFTTGYSTFDLDTTETCQEESCLPQIRDAQALW
uniref:MAK10-like protein n=1 Tax=Tanacetum cinerariifolium TaxID=118510 RepID=A0A6L2LCR2_TANCI|nr:hypothetical protein [Tanacetum cinerariifolium]